MAYIASISSDYGCFRYSWIQVYGLQDTLSFSLFLVFLSSLWASFSGKVVSLWGRSGHHRPVLHLEKRRYPHCTLLPTKIPSKVPGVIDKTWVMCLFLGGLSSTEDQWAVTESTGQACRTSTNEGFHSSYRDFSRTTKSRWEFAT